MQIRRVRPLQGLSLDQLEARDLLSGVPLVGPHQPGDFDHLAGTALDAWHYLGDKIPDGNGFEQVIKPDRSVNFVLEPKTLRAALPDEVFTLRPESQDDRRIITLPKPDGTLERFEVFGADVIPETMWKEYANIRTYRGVGLDDPTALFVGDFTEQGFHAQVQTPNGWWYIDPVYHGNSEIYQSYFLSDYTKNPHEGACGCALCAGTVSNDVIAPPRTIEGPVTLEPTLAASGGIGGGPGFSLNDPGELSWGGSLRTYRTAITTDTSYFAYHDGAGTDPIATRRARVLSAIVTSINRISGFYESEVSARLQLIANNDLLLFDGTATADPFLTPNESGGNRLNVNQTTIDNLIGANNYELGHSYSGLNLGGLAQLRSWAVNGSESLAYTGLANPINDFWNINYVSHEMGHQAGGNHTHNAFDFIDQVNYPTAVAPGNGSTVQDYTNQGGTDNYQAQSDPQFSWASLREITAHLANPLSGGFTVTANANSIPRVVGGGDYVIPARTMFALNAQAADSDGDNLTYSWEQADATPAQVNLRRLNQPDNGTGPLFRPFFPTASPTRSFPSASSVSASTINFNGSVPVDGTLAAVNSYGFSRAERLPTTNRDLNFNVVVRDNRVGGAAFAYDSVNLKVVDTGSAFAVTNATASWAAGSKQTVTWNVAGTTANGINTDQVRISLSTDGGLTFPHVLLDRTPNDGNQDVVLPYVSSAANLARIRVEATNSVFFAVSNKLTLTAVSAPVGTVSGVSFVDRNGNGVRDGEPAAPNRLIYADGDGNGRFDQGYPTVVVAASYPLTLADETRTRVPFNLSSVSGTVADLRVRLNITHANPGELNAALISPSGRRVELFSSLGNSGANLTNLTLSSSAVLGVNQTAAPYTGTFKPEGNLEEFIGDTINGTWQLEVSDVAAGNVGTLSDWTLLIANEFASTAAPFTITTSGQNKLAPLTVPALVGTVTDVDVKVNLTVGDTQSASFWLYNPNVPATASPVPAAAIRLFNRSPQFQSNFTNTILDDQAATSITAGTGPFTGRFRPDASFLSYYDQPSDPITGTWHLNVRSEFGGFGSQFHMGYVGWSLLVTREFAATAFAPVAVPDNGSATSTLPATLVGGPLQDVGVTLNITHPDVSQVKAYLTSPAGSKVLLASGGSGNNFVSTVFDDEASTKFSVGTAPYTATFRPVESLSRFDGEDGTGTWTLTIQDTATGSTGTLTGWSLQLRAPTTVESFGVPMSVGNIATRSSTLFVSNSAGPLSDLDLSVKLAHPVTGELAAFLTSPAGTKITLVAAGATSGANWTNTTFDDEAASSITVGLSPYSARFRPSAALSAFDGQWANGLWTLELTDSNLAANAGTLSSWSLSYSTGERFTLTDANGNYSFAVPAGSYTIREELPGDLNRTTPVAGGYTISVTTGNPTFPNSNFSGVGTVLAGPSLQVSGGATQRSRVTSISIVGFGNITAAAAGTFTLTRTGPGTPNTPQTLTVLGFTPGANDTTVISLALPAAYTQNGSLIDGSYSLSANWTSATVVGAPLSGTTTHTFHRLFGDSDGDRDVDAIDLGVFRTVLNGTFNAAYDFDTDGDVDLIDLGRFRQRFGTTLP